MTTSLSVGLHVCFCDMQHGKTALHMAAEIKNAEIIDVLASFRNIDVNRTNSNGETALYVSSRVVHTATASHLLAAGADANAARPDDGSTPLHCACQDGDGSALVGLLLDGGARPDVGGGRRGRTSLESLRCQRRRRRRSIGRDTVRPRRDAGGHGDGPRLRRAAGRRHSQSW